MLVTLDIVENREQRVFPDMEIALLTGDESELAQASPATVDVVVEGPMSQVRGLDRKSIDVYIDPDDIPFGQRRRKEVVAETPVGSDVTIVQLTPKDVMLFRSRKPRPKPSADAGVAPAQEPAESEP